MTRAATTDGTATDPAATGDLQVLLTEGVTRGLITADQAAGLAALARAEAPDGAGRDDERLRLVTGFADIFVTLGLLLFLGAACWFVERAAGPGVRGAVAAGLAWGLAEFFTRRRRMALPSLVLLLVFAMGTFTALTAALGGTGTFADLFAPFETSTAAAGAAIRIAVAFLATAGLVGLHYGRFRVPITVAAGSAALVGSLLGLLAAIAPHVVEAHLDHLILAAGLALFALAMRFDLADPARVTRATDVAFWLHLLAAPLIVHPLLSGLIAARGSPGAGAALAVLAVFLGLAVVAVLIDRRAMLVSGLVYAGIAFGSLADRAGISTQVVPLSLLVLGAFILLLSAGWHPLRRVLLSLLPSAAARLPHPTGS